MNGPRLVFGFPGPDPSGTTPSPPLVPAASLAKNATARFMSQPPLSPPSPTPRCSAPTILMCPPEHYGIEYEINTWMSRDRPADRAIAARQWQGLHALLVSLG